MNYYTLKNGEYIPVTKAECFANDETKDLALPFKQRWYIEESICVRLPRTQAGEDIFFTHIRDKQREEKYQQRKIQCVWKGTKKCDQDCNHCNRKNTSRTVELDMHFGRDDFDNEGRFEPVADCNIAGIAEEKALLDTLKSALAELTTEDRGLLKAIFNEGKTERELAPLYNYKQPKSINKRKHKLLKILRQNEALKEFFK